MNEIIKQRIEEEARDIAELCPDCNLHCKGPSPCIPKIIYEKLIEIADFVVQNQWISVDEALPKDYEDVFILYDHGIPSVGYCEKINGEIKWYRRIDRTPIIMVTLWMEIPLEGGEK